MTDAAILPAHDAIPAAPAVRLQGSDLVAIIAAAFASFIFAFLAAAAAGGVYGIILAATHRAVDQAAIAGDKDLLQTCVFVGVIYGTAAVLLGSWGVAQRRGLGLAAIGLGRSRAWWWFLVGLTTLTALIAYNVLMAHYLDPDGAIQAKLQKRLLLRTDSLAWIVAMWVAVAPLTAIAEELLYRGLLYRWFRERLPVGLAVLVSALIFSLLHGSLISPGGWMGASMAVSLTLVGIVTALLFEASGSLWPSILIHFVNNSLFVIGAYNPSGG